MVRWSYMLHILGSLIVCIGLCMLAPLGFSFYYRDGSALPLLISAGITVGVGLFLYLVFRRGQVKGAISHREGMAIRRQCSAACLSISPASCPSRRTSSLKAFRGLPPPGLR